MGEMRRAISREEQERQKQDRFNAGYRRFDHRCSQTCARRYQPAISQSPICDHGQRSTGEVYLECDRKVTGSQAHVRTIRTSRRQATDF
jgi:hypothetical protein